MRRYALCGGPDENGLRTVEFIVWNPAPDAPEGYIAVECPEDNGVEPGYTWDGMQFAAPVEPPPEAEE